MKNRIKDLELVSGKARADCATGGEAAFKQEQAPAITLRKKDSLKIQGLKACKGKCPVGDMTLDERDLAVRATIKKHSIEPVGVFKDNVLWHTIEFQDEDAGHSCEFSGVEGEITFGPVPKPQAEPEIPEEPE